MDAAAQQTAATTPNLSIDKFIEGGITCLRFQGTVDESFDGKRLAASIKANTLILDLGGIRKISSFGIREWSDFIRGVERQIGQLIAIECTPKVVDQLNMVAHFLGGKGQVFSFYAPYRCDYCDIDRQVLFQVDRDQQAIRSMQPPEQLCETCSRPSYFDEEPGAFFGYLAAQQPFELEPAVAEFLSSKLRYSVAGGDRRLHIDKHIEGRNTYLKFVGNLDGSFPSNKIAEGLEGTIVVDVSGVGTIDLAGAAEWRNFITQAKASAERVLLVGCPPILLERLTRQGDLGDQVLSFSMPYSCSKCATTASQVIDVEQHYDILKFATPPEMRCSHCKSPTVCVAPENLLSRLRTLPPVDIEPGLRKFIKEMRERKPEKPQSAKKPAQQSGTKTSMVVALVGVVLIAAGVLVGVNWYQQRQAQTKLEKAIDGVRQTTDPSVTRPAWITSTTPTSSYCTDNVERLSCVGMSSYLASREAARVEATNAALEGLVNAVSLKIEGEMFDQRIRSRYEASRTAALQELENTRADPESDAYSRAIEIVRSSRKAVAESLIASGGSAAPAQQAAWYWEEYDEESGAGTEFLVWVRYDISVDALRALREEYSVPTDVQGSQVVTAFPALNWRYPDLGEGVVVVSAGGLLAERGVEDRWIITKVAGEPVHTSAELAEKLSAKPDAKLTVRSDEGGEREI